MEAHDKLREALKLIVPESMVELKSKLDAINCAMYVFTEIDPLLKQYQIVKYISKNLSESDKKYLRAAAIILDHISQKGVQ